MKSMIINERIVSYIHSLERSNGILSDEMEAYAHQNSIPIIRKEMESFLKVMITIKKPERILELGTAIGYSAILMASVMPEHCKITTIENYQKRIDIATDNIQKTGLSDKIELISGDALDILKKLNETWLLLTF